MTTKNLVILTAVAAALAGTAYWTGAGRKMKAPSDIGKAVLPPFAVGDVARIEINGMKSVRLAAKDSGWVVESLYGYPADVTKIRENVLKLQDLKVGQMAAGQKIDRPATVELKNAAGKSLAALKLGGPHMRKASGQMAMYGGGSFPDGRYLLFGDRPVLVKDTLDAFDGDPRKWIEARIAEVPAAEVASVSFVRGAEKIELTRSGADWKLKGLGAKEELDTTKIYGLDGALSYLDLASVLDPAKESTYGFETGSVHTVVLKNGITYTAKVGNVVGSDRAFKISAAFTPSGTNTAVNAACEKTVKDFNAKAGKWVYAISSYAADTMSKTRKDLVKAKEEPKKESDKKVEPVKK